MNLVKWDPRRGLEDVSNSLSRIFGRPVVRAKPRKEMLATMVDWAPSVDISETDAEYLVKAEIPGVNKEDVEVTIQNGMLTIQGERKLEKEEKEMKFHRVERCYGSFMRRFQVPDDADEDKIKAEFRDGMLNVTMAKSERARSRQVNVSVS